MTEEPDPIAPPEVRQRPCPLCDGGSFTWGFFNPGSAPTIAGKRMEFSARRMSPVNGSICCTRHEVRRNHTPTRCLDYDVAISENKTPHSRETRGLRTDLFGSVSILECRDGEMLCFRCARQGSTGASRQVTRADSKRDVSAFVYHFFNPGKSQRNVIS